MRKTFLLIGILLLSGALGLSLSLYRHQSAPPIVSGPDDVQISQTFHSPVSFVKQLKDDPNAGRKIFKEFCTSCHGVTPVIDIHAPRIGDKTTWKSLRQLGIPALLNLTIKGGNVMPARGGCFECSDQQLRVTIEYILKESR